MHQRSLITNPAITPHQDIIGDRLTEHLHLQNISNNLLRLPVNIGVHERDVIVAGDDVAQGGETLFDSLEGDGGGQGVAEMLKLLVGGGRGDEKAVAVSCGSEERGS